MKSTKLDVLTFDERLVTHTFDFEISQEEVSKAEEILRLDRKAFDRMWESWGISELVAKYGIAELHRLKYSDDGRTCSHFAFGYDVITEHDLGISVRGKAYPIYADCADVRQRLYRRRKVA
jgi:hypothetical protein